MSIKKMLGIVGLVSLVAVALSVAGCSVRVGGSSSPSPSPSASSPSASPSATYSDPSETLPTVNPSSSAYTINPEPIGTKPPASAAFLDSFIGLSLADAEQKAKTAGYVTRVVSIDGQPQMVTMDYSDSRLNFDIVNNKVTKVIVG